MDSHYVCPVSPLVRKRIKLEVALAEAPDDIHLMLDLAKCYEELHNTGAAERMYLQAYQICDEQKKSKVVDAANFVDPAFIFVELAGMYRRIERYDLAEKYLKGAATLHSDNEEIQRDLGEMQMELDHYGEAAESFQRSLDINANQPYLHFQMAWIRRNGGSDERVVQQHLMDAWHFSQHLHGKEKQSFRERIKAFNKNTGLPVGFNQAEALSVTGMVFACSC